MCKGHKNLCQNHLKELLYRQACVALWRHFFVFWVGVSKSTFHLSNAGDDMFYVIHGSSGHFVLCMVFQREHVPHLTGLCCAWKQIVVIFLQESA